MDSLNLRIKQSRLDANLTQKEMADLLGLTQSGVSLMEQPGRNVSDITIKSICRVLSLSETWLREGTGPMRIQKDAFSLDRFAKEREMSQTELQILKIYFEMDPKIRHEALDYFLKRITELHLTARSSSIPSTPEELEAQYPPVDTQKKTG